MYNKKRLVLYGIMTALALICSYIESQIPVFFAVPGMKLGLTNIVVVTALYYMGSGSAMVINIMRILMTALLFGNAVSLAYSLAGGMLSCIVMIIMKKSGKFSAMTVSIAGGITHNIGQILVAMMLMETPSLAWYMCILWFTGAASGAVIGIIGGEICKRLPKGHALQNK